MISLQTTNQRLFPCRIIFLLFAFILIFSRVFACDVSLFVLISGETRADTFAVSMSALALDASTLAEYRNKKDKNQVYLDRLMARWLSVCTQFQNTPPEWALNDSRWNEKFNEMSLLLGKIRLELSVDQHQTHLMLKKFTRLMSNLYEYMPMNSVPRLRIKITRFIDFMWDAYFQQNRKDLKSAAKGFTLYAKMLISGMPPELVKNAQILYDRGLQIQDMIEEPEMFSGNRGRMLLDIAEYEFIEINNVLLSLQQKSGNIIGSETRKINK